MIEIWPYIVSGLCGFLLAVIVLCLIFIDSFRKDITAAGNNNKAKLFNIITVEGAFIIVLCGMVFFGLLYPVVYPNAGPKVLMQASGLDKESVQDLINAHVDLQDRYSDLEKAFNDDKAKMEDSIKVSEIESYIENLSANSELGKVLLRFPSENKGPWSKFEKSEVIKVSIPGKVEQGHAWVCHDRLKSAFDLFSDLEINGEKIIGQTTSVVADKLIFPSQDCDERVSIDMQISCADAELIYTSRVLSCDADGNAQWKLEKPKELLALSVYKNVVDE